MSLSFRSPTSALITVPALASTLMLAACGTTTVDPKSGENLIKKHIPSLFRGTATVKSVSCPSGIKPTDGAKFDCQADIVETANSREHKGPITLHIVGGGKQLEFRVSDVHAP